MKITAKGVLFGTRIKVECIEADGDFLFDFNGLEDSTLEKTVRDEMKKCHTIAGTFTPMVNSPLNVKNVLEFHFFDRLTSINVEGDLGTLPYEDGRIY